MLRASGAGQTGIFDDLGTGVGFGSQTFSAANNGQIVSVPLNAASLADLNAKRGGLVALGGALTSIVGSADQAVFDGAVAMAWTAIDAAADETLRRRLLAAEAHERVEGGGE